MTSAENILEDEKIQKPLFREGWRERDGQEAREKIKINSRGWEGCYVEIIKNRSNSRGYLPLRKCYGESY